MSIYCLGLAITFNQSFRVSSYELSTNPSLIWVLGSWIQPPLETKLLGFGKPSPSIWIGLTQRDLASSGDPPSEAPPSIILLKETVKKLILAWEYVSGSHYALQTLSRMRAKTQWFVGLEVQWIRRNFPKLMLMKRKGERRKLGWQDDYGAWVWLCFPVRRMSAE